MNTNKKQKKWNLELVPLLAVILLVPLVVRLHIAETDLGSYPWLPDNMSQRADFFLYGKSRVLLVLAVIMLFCMIDGFLLRGKRAGLKRLLPLFGYEIFVVLSAVSAEFRTFAMHGIKSSTRLRWSRQILTSCIFSVTGRMKSLIWRYFIMGSDGFLQI